MQITILTDNVAGGRFLAEHGLSYLIEIDNEKILFDTGHSDVFLKNAEKLGINIKEDVKQVVLSHGHWDHGNGLAYLSGKQLLTHPGAFIKRYRKRDNSPIGLYAGRDIFEQNFTLQTSKIPVQLSSNLWFMGEIPRTNDFESQSTTFLLDNSEEDFIDDDSALVAIIDEQLVVISGCAHSGICNICEYAKKITGLSKIKAVMGGFHLKKKDRQTLKTIEYFKANGIKTILPSHCTQLPAKALFLEHFIFPEVKTGMVFHF